jgi:hypothetical protein
MLDVDDTAAAAVAGGPDGKVGIVVTVEISDRETATKLLLGFPPCP